MTVDALAAIFGRRSIGRLTGPGPDAAQLETILQAAAAAPDHGELRPFRFTVLRGDDRAAFGTVLAEAYLARCAAGGVEPQPAKVDKERTKLERAPVVVIAGAATTPGQKVPPVEQADAVAAACQNALLAATALGFGSMWRSGDPAHDPHVAAAVGLGSDDRIVGFLYLGTIPPGGDKPPRRPSLDGLVLGWKPPA